MATHKNNWAKSVLETWAFFFTYFMFAVVGILVSLICLIPAGLFRGVKARFFGQEIIHTLFRFFMGYLRRFGLVELDTTGMSAFHESNGLIFVANHPCLLDAVMLVAQLPRGVCLMKGSLARNLIFSGTARLAGYIHNKSSLGLVKKCEERLKEGTNLLVFPEGTRTVGGKLLPFKMGFALVAVSTGVPVQTVIITANSNCLGKGEPLFKQPAFPLRYSLRPGVCFVPQPGENAKLFGGRVENYFRERLMQPAVENLSATQSK